MVDNYHIVIIGSGPAGLGVAEVLKTDTILSSRILILEKGRPLDERKCSVTEGKGCKTCNPCNILSGVGGAGPYTDGKICLYPQDLEQLFPQKLSTGEVNGEREENKEATEKIKQYLLKVQKIWEEHGVTDFKKVEVTEKMSNLQSDALKNGINFTSYPVLHIGSDGAKKVLREYIEDIKKSGIKLEPNSEVKSISRSGDYFEITYKRTNNPNAPDSKVIADYVVFALGRDMQKPIHINGLFKNLDPKPSFKPKNLEIGCRVEVPHQIMDEVIQITFDPKFTMITPTHKDSVRTFCTCHRGRVVRKGNCVNGHIDRSKLTDNTNFALLVRWPLDMMLLDDAMDYGSTIAKLALAQGKSKPLIQRLGDLRNRVPSSREDIEKCYIKPTLRLDRNVTPGDISSCYPSRITQDILEGLEMLNTVIKGINNDQNLVYAPEIKPTCSVTLKNCVKTEVPHLYVCGDFSGHTRGLAQAMSMGMMVGEDILNEKKKGLQMRLNTGL